MALIEAMTADAIVALNLQAVQTFGGSHGILQEGCPERCTKNAEMAEYYEGNGEADELGLTYISALMYYLIENHCFLDGNKRTGLAVGLHLFYEMGATLNATNEELVKMCEDVAEGVIPDRPALAAWLAERLIEDE